MGQESPQSGPFLFHLGREAAATFLAGHPDIAKGSEEALLGLSTFAARLPSPEQPCIPAQGKLLLCSPSPQPREILQVHMVVLQGKQNLMWGFYIQETLLKMRQFVFFLESKMPAH